MLLRAYWDVDVSTAAGAGPPLGSSGTSRAQTLWRGASTLNRLSATLPPALTISWCMVGDTPDHVSTRSQDNVLQPSAYGTHAPSRVEPAVNWPGVSCLGVAH